MGAKPLVTIIIDNYNYAQFLPDAIRSALDQTYAALEVIVVDDGSTDNSRGVVKSFGRQVREIFKPNGGQGSAFNAGFAASHGEIVVFLDSDDVLLSMAVERAVPFFSDPDVAKVHWPLTLVDQDLQPLGRVCPAESLPQGDFRSFVVAHGPTNLLSAPGCGNAWARWFLEKVLPLPEDLYRNGGDTFLFETAPFFGKLGFVREPQTLYRQHGQNDHRSMPAEEKIARELRFYEHYAAFLAHHCDEQGLLVDLDSWRKRSWWHRHNHLLNDIAALPYPDRPIILVDDGTLELGDLAGRPRRHFLEREGRYWGPPPDGDTAIRELHLQRESGAAFIIFSWTAFWWRDIYPAFFDHLDANFECLVCNERCVIYCIA